MSYHRCRYLTSSSSYCPPPQGCCHASPNAPHAQVGLPHFHPLPPRLGRRHVSPTASCPASRRGHDRQDCRSESWWGLHWWAVAALVVGGQEQAAPLSQALRPQPHWVGLVLEPLVNLLGRSHWLGAGLPRLTSSVMKPLTQDRKELLLARLQRTPTLQIWHAGTWLNASGLRQLPLWVDLPPHRFLFCLRRCSSRRQRGRQWVTFVTHSLGGLLGGLRSVHEGAAASFVPSTKHDGPGPFFLASFPPMAHTRKSGAIWRGIRMT